MEQKRVVALMLIVALSTLVITPIALTNRANANFAFPPSNPIITFNSPVNTTYTKNNVSLNLTIETYKTGYNFEGPFLFQYAIDGNDSRPIEITNSSIGRNPGGTVRFDGLIDLHELSEGNHSLTLKAVLNYNDGQYRQWHTESTANAYLIIDAIPDNTPTPINSPIENNEITPSELVIPIIAAITIIAVSVSMYYLRMKR